MEDESCLCLQYISSQVLRVFMFFYNYIFKRLLIFLPVHVQDKAQHGGWILPGWEEHDMVASESNIIH